MQEQYEGNDIWIWDTDTRTRTRLTVGEAGGWYPTWNPAGDRVAYGAAPGGGGAGSLAWTSADYTGTPEVLIRPSSRSMI